MTQSGLLIFNVKLLIHFFFTDLLGVNNIRSCNSIDGIALMEMLHSHGVICHYLGHLAQLTIEEEEEEVHN